MQTKILKIDFTDYHPDQLLPAAKILSQGGLVIFPTETVYGIGCNARDPQALERLYRIKQRPADKPFTIHLAQFKMLEEYVTQLPNLAYKLARRYWPGPLTLVVPDRHGKHVGLRLPDHILARDLILQANVPVAAPSANLSGQPPPVNAEQALAAFDGSVEMVIDGGPTYWRCSSTVVMVDQEGWRILRAGAISQKEIQELDCVQILFVCTGNTCRSPMAEGLLKMRLCQRLELSLDQLESEGIRVRSAGTAAVQGAPATAEAVQTMQAYGCDISAHRSTPLNMEMCEAAEHIYVMTYRHRSILLEWMPHLSSKLSVVTWQGSDIEDPIGSGLAGYHNCARKLIGFIDEKLMKERFKL